MPLLTLLQNRNSGPVFIIDPIDIPINSIDIIGKEIECASILDTPINNINIIGQNLFLDSIYSILVNIPTNNFNVKGQNLSLDTTKKYRRFDMTISNGDVKFRKSIRQTDTVNNGGPKGQSLIVSGARHNLFPRVTKSERTNGVTRYRKQFWCNENPDDFPAYGVMIFLEFPSTGGDHFALCKGTQDDVQNDINANYVFGGIGRLNSALVGGETQISLMMDSTDLEFYNGDYLHIADKVLESQTIGGNVRVGDSVEKTSGVWNKISATTDIEYPKGVYLGGAAILTFQDTTSEEWVQIAMKQTENAVIGTGDGNILQVSLASLANTNPIQGKRELAPIIRATCGGSVREVKVNPDGVCSGYCAGGELNLQDGTWTTQITWQTAPDDGTDIIITYCEIPYTYTGNVATVELEDPVNNSYNTVTTYGSVCVYEDEVDLQCSPFSVNVVGSSGYDETTHPIILHNDGTEREDWTIQFTNGSSFTCTGSRINGLDNGNIGNDYAPINPNTGQPYFEIKKEGWSGIFNSGDTITFSTYPTALPIWLKEIVPAGTVEESRNLLVCGYYTE